MSYEKPTVFEALKKVMTDVQSVGKNDRNSQQGYAFRGVDAVVNAVGPVLRQYGVIIAPFAAEAHYRDVQTSTGKPSRECTVNVTYRAYGPAGDFIEVSVPGESMDFGDKGAPKAMSVAYRIALLQLLCIPTDEVDPDSQSYERAPAAVAVPERVTDPDWFNSLEQRVDMAASVEDVRTLWAEVAEAHTAFGCSDVDRLRLEALLTNRRNELQAAVTV